MGDESINIFRPFQENENWKQLEKNIQDFRIKSPEQIVFICLTQILRNGF